MTEENRIEFDGALLKIAKMYGYQLDKEQAELYYEIMKDFSIDSVKLALLKTARTVKFFPKPSEIIENMSDGGANKLDYDFEYCKSMIKDLGFHSSVILPSKMLMAVIRDLGGLQEFSEAISKDEKDTYFKFKRAHGRRTTDAQNGSLPDVKRLIGYMENLSNQNSNGGTYQVSYWDNKPAKTLIGGKTDDVKQLAGNPEKVADMLGEVMKKIAGGQV